VLAFAFLLQEALEVLRTTLTEVRLKVCRPPAGAGLLSVEPEDNDSNIPVAPPRLGALKNNKADRSSDDSDADDEEDRGNSSKPCAVGVRCAKIFRWNFIFCLFTFLFSFRSLSLRWIKLIKVWVSP
jgi:hypothetical protein